jgi:hypothetical protein
MSVEYVMFQGYLDLRVDLPELVESCWDIANVASLTESSSSSKLSDFEIESFTLERSQFSAKHESVFEFH